MEIGVGIEFGAVLEPSDVRPWRPLGHAQEDDFVAQHVLVIKVRGQNDFRALLEFASSQ
jgi:hypothetical protein